jgi:hypothetical protein
VRSGWAWLSFALLAACNGGEAKQSASAGTAGTASAAPGPPATASAASPPAVTAAAKAFGQPIGVTATTSLADIARAPAAFKGKVVATEGTVTRVCQERGCWMAIKDQSGTATVRMHGHAFFVPTTSSGKHARVQGTVVLMKDGHECDEMEALDAKLELDATGIELL